MSVAPPGWTPQPAVVTAGAPLYRLDDLRSEGRRDLDGRRVGARFVDWLIVAPFAAIAAWYWGWHIGTYALYQCLLLILHHVCEVTTGATPGKRLFGLRVARLDDGELPTPRQAAARGVIGIFEFGLIAPIVIICNKGRRRLGDFAAGTAVVDARKHPTLGRPLFRGALAYPVAWAVPAIVACVLGARGDVPGSYRTEADAVCTATGRALPTVFARYGAPGAARLLMERDARLDALSVPAAWRGRHEELLRRLRTETTYIAQGVRDARASPYPTLVWTASQRHVKALARDDGPAIAALGYHACGG